MRRHSDAEDGLSSMSCGEAEAVGAREHRRRPCEQRKRRARRAERQVHRACLTPRGEPACCRRGSPRACRRASRAGAARAPPDRGRAWPRSRWRRGCSQALPAGRSRRHRSPSRGSRWARRRGSREARRRAPGRSRRAAARRRRGGRGDARSDRRGRPPRAVQAIVDATPSSLPLPVRVPPRRFRARSESGSG